MTIDKYIYREFTNQNGNYQENMNITEVFNSIDDLMNMINARKKFYKSYWYKRKIEIEIVPEKLKDSDNKDE